MSPQGGLCGSGGHGRAESAVQPGGGSPAPCPRGQRAALQGRWRRSRQRGSCPPVAPAGAPPPARLCPRPDALPANFVLLQWPEAPPATSAAPPAVPAGSRPSAGRGNRGTADGGLGSEIGPGGCRLLGCTRRPSCRVLTCPSNKGANPVLGLHPRDLAASPRPRLLTQPRVRAGGGRGGWASKQELGGTQHCFRSRKAAQSPGADPASGVAARQPALRLSAASGALRGRRSRLSSPQPRFPVFRGQCGSRCSCQAWREPGSGPTLRNAAGLLLPAGMTKCQAPVSADVSAAKPPATPRLRAGCLGLWGPGMCGQHE